LSTQQRLPRPTGNEKANRAPKFKLFLTMEKNQVGNVATNQGTRIMFYKERSKVMYSCQF
jgi:hypothetical protein